MNEFTIFVGIALFASAPWLIWLLVSRSLHDKAMTEIITKHQSILANKLSISSRLAKPNSYHLTKTMLQ